MNRAPRKLKRPAPSQLRHRKPLRGLRVEQLEARQLLATLTTGTGEGHVEVQVNEYGAFGYSPFLDVTVDLDPAVVDEVGDAFYDPVDNNGPLGRAGTMYESGVALSVNGALPEFLTAGTIQGSGNFNNASWNAVTSRQVVSTFFYPRTALIQDDADFVITLTQTLTPKILSGTTPIGVTLTQQYQIRNLTGSTATVQFFRYADSDLQFTGGIGNDGAGMVQQIQSDPEDMFFTDTATNTNRNDPTYMEVRTSNIGIVRPNRWEAGLYNALATKILAGGALADDIIPTANDLDGNNKVDNGRGADWTVALRNVYTIPGGQFTVYTTETQWGDPELGDVDPPVYQPPARGLVAGRVFFDANADGNQDAGEYGIGGVRVYADNDGNDRWTPGEPFTMSQSNGDYVMSLVLGNYVIRQEVQPGFTQTVPGAGYSVSLVNQGDLIDSQDFGVDAPPGSISGFVYIDYNRNGRFDPTEVGLPGATVFADANYDGVLQAGEVSTVTAADGTYTLANVEIGSYIVRQIVPAGYEQISPSANGGQVVTISPAAAINGVNFSSRLLDGQVTGKVYYDTNSNGVIDAGDTAAVGVMVYLDYNNSCAVGIGENAIITDDRGTFGLMGIVPGTYTARLALAPGMVQVLPAGGTATCLPGQSVTVTPGSPSAPVDFLVAGTGPIGSTQDFGDLPPGYPVTLAQNGARHDVAQNFGLGLSRDTEFNGVPSGDASGDDLDFADDEDGVTPTAFGFVPGQFGSVNVTVQTGNRAPGRLQAWIDFNGDLDFNDAGEQISLNRLLGAGTHTITFPVPANAKEGVVYGRFRYGYEMNLGPTGPSILGEVEDHAFNIVGLTVDAEDDPYLITNFTQRQLNVLNNDTGTVAGPPVITSFTPPADGTLILVDNSYFLYTPSGNQLTGELTFQYTVESNGTSDTATVFLNFDIAIPAQLVDDTIIGVENLVGYSVLTNDDPVVPGPLTVFSFTQPVDGLGVQQGTVNITPDGFVTYTPPVANPTYAGTVTFTYTGKNASSVPDAELPSATVTLVVQPAVADDDDELLYTIQMALPDNTIIADNTAVGLGQVIDVRVSVQDIRDDLVAPDAIKGAFSVFMDLLYDNNRLELVPDPLNPFGFDITFGPSYDINPLGDFSQPGVIDQVGAAQDSPGQPPQTPLGPGNIRLFSVRMRVKSLALSGEDALPGPASITTDPAESTDDEEVVFFEPPSIVPFDRITLDQAIVNVVPGTPIVVVSPQPQGQPALDPTPISGSGKHRNMLNPADVNFDSHLSPLDALLVINALNANGTHSLQKSVAPSMSTNRVYIDVNGDDFITPLDALLIINKINNGGAQNEPAVSAQSEPITSAIEVPAGESVSVPMFEAPVSGATSSITSSSDSSAPLSTSPASSAPMLSEDLVLGTNASSTSTSSSSSSDDDDDFEDLLDALASDAAGTY